MTVPTEEQVDPEVNAEEREDDEDGDGAEGGENEDSREATAFD